MTTRDDVWSAALDLIGTMGAFKRADLGFADEQRHTVRRTLRQMEAHGWLFRTSQYSPIWRAGPRARDRLQFEDGALEAADPVGGFDADGTDE